MHRLTATLNKKRKFD